MPAVLTNHERDQRARRIPEPIRAVARMNAHVNSIQQSYINGGIVTKEEALCRMVLVLHEAMEPTMRVRALADEIAGVPYHTWAPRLTQDVLERAAMDLAPMDLAGPTLAGLEAMGWNQTAGAVRGEEIPVIGVTAAGEHHRLVAGQAAVEGVADNPGGNDGA